ncbi:MAG: UvrD-helicase domain-containing protein [Spirochaetaceae bacterium]|jgi:DNA helicase-2/ATP-dependent DNA helicase PcrA|nr:UvrD-helicase domain-containing protein [Spirochaetaceae bacterium]
MEKNDEAYFAGLNENQIEAVKTTEGYVRIIAGAGSGKTKVLANRYAYIVERLGVSPAHILCVTFSNRAAREMKSRIQKLLAEEPINDFICTFHGFCVRVLREDIFTLAYPRSFSILDAEDQKAILKEIYEKFGVSASAMTYQQLLKKIEQFKISKPYIDDFIIAAESAVPDDETDMEKKILAEYIRIQKKNFALDFEDLISFTLYIFAHFGHTLRKWQEKLEYIMVDETQDNSRRQWRLADLLSEVNKNLFVVGDPDQSIYEWRGAVPAELVNFDKVHTSCKTIVLNQNYRSYQKILDVANSIIAKNTMRISKDMFTERTQNAAVIHVHSRSETEEANWVAGKIKEKLRTGIPINNIAVLYRSVFISRSFEQAFIKEKIPYIVYGGIRFFERKEIKDAIAYLKLIALGDDISFLRIINYPSRKLGKAYIEKIKQRAAEEGLPLYETLKKYIGEKGLNRPSGAEFIALIEKLRQEAAVASVSDLLQSALEKSGVLQAVRQDGDEDRLDNIHELMQSVKLYEQSMSNEENVGLIQYLQDVALYTNIDYKQDAEFLKLMTIHQAKGLEFEIVFVVGMSEGLFPNHRSLRDRRSAALEEERRLAYVAVTRAEKELYLTESEGFFYETGDKYPSRFIYEIKPDLLETVGRVPAQIKNELLFLKNKITYPEETEVPQFETGDAVVHPSFGTGTITAVGTENYTVFFDDLQKTKPISKLFKGLTGDF